MYYLIVSAVFPPEPLVSAKLSFDIAASLSNSSEVYVISPRPSRPPGFNFTTINEPVKFKHIKLDSFTCPKPGLFGRLFESLSFGLATLKYISKNRKDIKQIYANTWPLLAQYYTVKAAKKYGIPLVLHIQDIYPESLANKLPIGKSFIQRLLLPLDKYLLKNTDKIIAISEKMKSYLTATREIAPEKIFVVCNWQDEETFESYHNRNTIKKEMDQLFTFMYLGNIGPVAGVELLIDAFVKAGLNNCRLVIAGSGSMKPVLENRIKCLKEVKIECCQVPEGKVAEVQDSADVLLLPVKKGAALSSIPSKLPAYMFSKKAIIASVDKESDTANAIKAAKCGWVISPGNSDMLADKMKMAATLPKEDLAVFGEKGFIYALEHFSRDNNLRKIIEVITGLSCRNVIKDQEYS